MALDHTALAVASGAVIGFALGATGGGGALLAVPLLVYLLGVKVQSAAAVSLVVVAGSALLGLYQRRNSGNIRVRIALVFSATGAVGAWTGAFGQRLVREETVLLWFGIMMLAAAWHMWRRGNQPNEQPGGERCAERFPRSCWITVSLIGLVVGVLTGFFGVGGGFVIVPALALVLGLPMRAAIGTSLLIIVLIAVGGFLGYLHSGAVDWQLTGLLLVGSGIGMTAGTKAAALASPVVLTRGFAVVAAGVAGVLLVHSGMTWFGGTV